MRRRTVIGSAGATLPTMLAGCVSDDFIEPIDDEEDTTDGEGENGFDEGDDEDENETGEEDENGDSETTDESDESETEDSNDEQSTDENGDEEAGDELEPDGDNDESSEEAEEETDESEEELDEETDAEGEGETDESEEETDAEGEGETDGSEEELDEEEEVDETEDQEDDDADIEEPPTSEITIQVTDMGGESIANAEIHGEGEPHEADIPLEFDGETNAEGIHSTPIYENEYTIEVDQPDYNLETVEHVHDGETEVTIELEGGDDNENDSFDELEGQVHYSGDYQDMYEVTEHSIEQQNPSGDESPLCLISLTVESVTEDHEVMVYYGGVAIDEEGSSVGSGTDSATSLGPGESTETTLEAYDCSGASDYQISLEATNASEVSGEN
jgi:hypothetical protein